MSAITLHANGEVRQVDTNGLSLGGALEVALGVAPDSNQVRINGTEYLGDLFDYDDIAEGSLITVTSVAVAQKGVSGA